MSHLKIAQSFVSAATSDPERRRRFATTNIARELDIGVIAGGRRNRGTTANARRDGLTANGQGYYFSEAVGIGRE